MSERELTGTEYLRHLAATRHESVRQVARWFDWDNLPEGLPRDTSASVGLTASDMLESLPDSPELTAGLRKLLEAKDCFVRAAIAARPVPREAQPIRFEDIAELDL